jgi:hypothetical protein
MRTCVYKWTSTNYYFYFWCRGRIIMYIVLLLFGKVHGKDRLNSTHCLTKDSPSFFPYLFLLFIPFDIVNCLLD